MDLTEEREADAEADDALVNCAHAARTHAFNWTAGELRQLYGRAADTEYAEKLAQPPFDILSPYQIARVRAWYLAQDHSLTTKLRLAAEYAGTGDWEPDPDAATLRAIAVRAGVQSELRLAALEICCRWTGQAVQALRLLTAKHPSYPDVYVAFEAEAARIRGDLITI